MIFVVTAIYCTLTQIRTNDFESNYIKGTANVSHVNRYQEYGWFNRADADKVLGLRHRYIAGKLSSGMV